LISQPSKECTLLGPWLAAPPEESVRILLGLRDPQKTRPVARAQGRLLVHIETFQDLPHAGLMTFRCRWNLSIYRWTVPVLVGLVGVRGGSISVTRDHPEGVGDLELLKRFVASRLCHSSVRASLAFSSCLSSRISAISWICRAIKPRGPGILRFMCTLWQIALFMIMMVFNTNRKARPGE
jgi:hypothetical protein